MSTVLQITLDPPIPIPPNRKRSLARPQYADKLLMFAGRLGNRARGIIRRLRLEPPGTKPQAHGTPATSQSDAVLQRPSVIEPGVLEGEGLTRGL